MKVPNKAGRAALLWASLFLGLTVFVLFWFLRDSDSSSRAGAETPSPGINSHIKLVKLLTELQPALVTATNGPGMLQFANDIESELSRNPLPPGDEFRFRGELVVRYLKTLGNLEIYRERKRLKGEADPLSLESSNANREAIATREKYLPWARERSRELRDMLTNSPPRPLN